MIFDEIWRKFCEFLLEFVDFRADFYRNFTEFCRINKNYQISAENCEHLWNFDKIWAAFLWKCLLVSCDTHHPSGSISLINLAQVPSVRQHRAVLAHYKDPRRSGFAGRPRQRGHRQGESPRGDLTNGAVEVLPALRDACFRSPRWRAWRWHLQDP